MLYCVELLNKPVQQLKQHTLLVLYNYAEEIGANKIALGHHRDDIIETLFLNMFYGAG